MSRSQQSQVLSTATANSGADQTNATNAVAAENQDIGNYEAQLSKYAASNPFTEGGEFETEQNKSLAGTADVGSKSLETQLQTQAKRTGENAGAAIATGAEAARANERELSTQEAQANQTRIGDEANYNAGVLQDTAAPVSMEAGVANPSLSASDEALKTAAGAAQQPSFWDEFGNSAAKGLGTLLTGGKGSQG